MKPRSGVTEVEIPDLEIVQEGTSDEKILGLLHKQPKGKEVAIFQLIEILDIPENTLRGAVCRMVREDKLEQRHVMIKQKTGVRRKTTLYRLKVPITRNVGG